MAPPHRESVDLEPIGNRVKHSHVSGVATIKIQLSLCTIVSDVYCIKHEDDKETRLEGCKRGNICKMNN